MLKRSAQRQSQRMKIIMFIAVAFCLAFESLFCQTTKNLPVSGGQMSWNNPLPHPRLFASEARIASIKLQKDKVSQQLLYILKNDAKAKLAAAKIVYPSGTSNFSASRNVQGRVISLALAYRMFNDKRYLEKAKEELLQLASINDWGTAHFLDLGEASLAAGIGYDWLYNNLTESERRTIAEAIKNKALLPSLQVKEDANNGSWVNGNFNWNPVCHGGLIVGALAVAEEYQQLSKQVVERAVRNIPIAGEAYSPDGAFAEGPSYWSYGTSFYVLAVEALRSIFGDSAGLENITGFLKTADYNNQMVGATGEEYNYSDYHLETQNEPIMLWFARELHRSDLAKDELSYINGLYEQWLLGNKEKSGDIIQQSRHTPFELLWWNPSLLQQTQTVSAPLQWTASGLMPAGVMRSAWNDNKATFVALKGGTPNNSHGHMDAGSFIMEADGVRWALDLGTESYDKMRAAKLDLWNYSQNSDRWSTFRVGPEGHNIIRFDGERQLISGKGEVQKLEMKNGVIGNVADLTSLYINKASKVLRTVLLYPDRSVSIHDEWTTKDNAVDVSFQWLTKAKVTKTKDGLLLEQGGQVLQLKIEQPSSMKALSIEVEDESAARKLQDSPNPGLSRIVIKMRSNANSNGSLLIHAIPGSINSKAKKENK